MHVEAGVDRLEVLQALDEEARADQKQKRERNLCDDESFAQRGGAAVDDRASLVFESRRHVRARRLERGNKSEDDGREERDRKREGEDRPIGHGVKGERRGSGGKKIDERAVDKVAETGTWPA